MGPPTPQQPARPTPTVRYRGASVMGPRLGDLDGCQSYALASFCGGAVYVGLRELHVWNCAGSTHKLVAGGLPIGLRIALGASTAIAVRAFAWQRRPEGLLSGMDECADANERWLRVLFGGGASADGER